MPFCTTAPVSERAATSRSVNGLPAAGFAGVGFRLFTTSVGFVSFDVVRVEADRRREVTLAVRAVDRARRRVERDPGDGRTSKLKRRVLLRSDALIRIVGPLDHA